MELAVHNDRHTPTKHHHIQTQPSRVHSLLHCLGYDHIEDSDYEIMHGLEEKMLSENGYKINY